MKIKTSTNKTINVSIRKTGKNIILICEDAGGMGVEGQVVKASKHEIDVLKSIETGVLKLTSKIKITVANDFVPSDERGV
jgi:hypothetical protein